MNMKKSVFLLFMLGAGLLSCTARTNSNPEATVAADEPITELADETQSESKSDKSAQVKPIHLTKAEFLKKVTDFEKNPNEWKYLGQKPAIIDFYATWCGPCKKIAPILDELAAEYKDQIVIYKIDTDKEKELAQAFGIRSIPTLLFVPMEGQPQISQGAMPKEALIEAINTVLLKK